jgi:lysophospholipase-2
MDQPPLIIAPTAAHTHTIIFLHSRGSTPESFSAAILSAAGSPGSSDHPVLPASLPSVKWVFPRARLRPASARADELTSQWFDMRSVERPQDGLELQLPGLRESVAEVLAVIEAEVALLAGGADRVVLAGLSQGCATAAHALLRSRRRLAAFVGLCGWMPFAERVGAICGEESDAGARLQRVKEMLGADEGDASSAVAEEDDGACLATPVFLAYCRDDNVVPVVNGEEMCKRLRDLGMQVEWRDYKEGGHWVNEPDGVDDLVRFLRSRCSKQDSIIV